MAREFASLNAAQKRTLEHYEALSVIPEISWFIGRARDDGSVEVIGLGEDFIWSLVIGPDGEAATQEAHIDPKTWSTGVAC